MMLLFYFIMPPFMPTLVCVTYLWTRFLVSLNLCDNAFGTLNDYSVTVLIQEKQPFERIEVSRDQALDMFSDNPFKVSKLTNHLI